MSEIEPFVRNTQYKEELAEKNINYRGSNVIAFEDGDSTSGAVYDYGKTTLVK